MWISENMYIHKKQEIVCSYVKWNLKYFSDVNMQNIKIGFKVCITTQITFIFS